MIRPTMSHAVNQEHLNQLMRDYASYLELQVEDLEKEIAKLKLEKSNLSWEINPDRMGK